MPLIKSLNAATTPCDPGVSATLGLVSVRRAADGVVAGCCMSVLFCGSVLFGEVVDLIIFAGAAVVRGRAVGEEFVFCASEQVAAKTMTMAVNIVLIMICSS